MGNNPIKRERSSTKTRSPWGLRIDAALNGRTVTWLAEQTGIGDTTLSGIMSSAMPKADNALKISQAIGVTVEYLLTGESSVSGLDHDQWAILPRRDLLAFSKDKDGQWQTPPVLEMVPIARRWLARLPITRSEIWVAEMPTSQMPSVAAQGELVICQDAGMGIHDNMVYAYFIENSTIIRRVQRPEGRLALVADDPGTPAITLGDNGLFNFSTLAQIVGAIRIQPAS